MVTRALRFRFVAYCVSIDTHCAVRRLQCVCIKQVRNANRVRQSQRPTDPTDLSFTLAMEHVPPNFFRQDIRVGDRRHLLFATDAQLALLTRARQWFVDATFYVVSPPFTQLFCVHAFVKRDDEIKQVPLIYVLMSGKKRRDYRKVRITLIIVKRIRGRMPSYKAYDFIICLN